MEPVRRASDERGSEAVEFVRFCYRRRRAGWPELYDEMCAVAGRGLYQGWTHEDLAERGIGFTLSQMPALAALVRQVIDEEDLRRRSARECPVPGDAGRPLAAPADEGPPPTIVRAPIGAVA
jgi:hypothetical protein